MKDVHKRRLLNVARACRETPHAEFFAMTTYGHECGTPACALGNYAARRDLQRTFSLTSDGELSTPENGDGWGEHYDESVLKHFGITITEAFELFGTKGCGRAKTAEEAALYIERFVERKESES